MLKTGVSYFHTRDPRYVERDLDEMVECGCNFVVHCFSETDLAWYNQAMDRIVRASKDRGLEVYLDPWGLGGLYGGETFSRFVAENLDARQVTRSGRSVAAACPNHPDFRKLQDQWIDRAAELGADVCFWDEPHFHFSFLDPGSWDDWACRCSLCRRLFRERTGEKMPTELTPEVARFRQRSVLDLLRDNCNRARRRGMRNAVCVLPDEGGPLGEAAGTASWESVAGIEELDVFGTDPYWVLFGADVESFVRMHCERVMKLCREHGKEAQAWVQAFIIPEDRENEVAQAVDTIHATGIRNIAAWGFRGCHLIDIRCSRPELVWETLCNAMKRLRDRESSG